MIYPEGTTFGDDWRARREAAERYIKERPWTTRRAFFESVIRASTAMQGPDWRSPAATPPTEGGTPGAGRLVEYDWADLRAAAA